MPFHRLPPLNSLRAFEVAARLSSFKAAAEELAVTPGAVSQQIRSLEDDLGVKLFDRAVRSVTLTEEGRTLQPALTKAFLQIRDVLEVIRPTVSTSVTMESAGPIISKWVLPNLHSFSQENPDLAVKMQSVAHVSEFGTAPSDVTLRLAPAIDAPSRHVVKICHEYLLPLASPDLIERLDLRAPQDLIRAPLLHDTSPKTFENEPSWMDWFAHHGMDPGLCQRGMRFDRHAGDQAIDAAINGAGVVFGRYFLAQEDMKNDRLICPFGPAFQMHAAYFVHCAEGEQCRNDIKAMMEWVQKTTAIGPRPDLLEDAIRPGG